MRLTSACRGTQTKKCSASISKNSREEVVYQPYQMLSNLAPREMTADQQRAVDEQRGQVAAAVARWVQRVVSQVPAATALPARHEHRPTAFRNASPARRRAPSIR